MSRLLKASIPLLMGTVIYQAHTIYKLNHVLAYQRYILSNLSEATTYMIDILEQHQVELNDFDVIALTNIFESVS